MRKLQLLKVIFACCICVCCAESVEEQPKTTPVATAPAKTSQYESVCDCYGAAITVLDEAIVLRRKFATAEDYLADKSSVAEMKVLMTQWNSVREACLKMFGSRVYSDKACDRDKDLQARRDTLQALGIRT